MCLQLPSCTEWFVALTLLHLIDQEGTTATGDVDIVAAQSPDNCTDSIGRCASVGDHGWASWDTGIRQRNKQTTTTTLLLKSMTWICWWRCFLPKPATQVPSLGPTWWKDRTNSQIILWHSHYGMWHKHTHIHTFKNSYSFGLRVLKHLLCEPNDLSSNPSIQDGRRELTPESCGLTFPCAVWCSYVHCLPTQTHNNNNKWEKFVLTKFILHTVTTVPC